MFIQEDILNKTEGHCISQGDWYKAFTDDLGDLFRSLQKEYGRATNMYEDDVVLGAVKVGWVFMGRDKYQDTGETYIREVWARVSATEPKRVTTTRNVQSPWAA